MSRGVVSHMLVSLCVIGAAIDFCFYKVQVENVRLREYLKK